MVLGRASNPCWGVGNAYVRNSEPPLVVRGDALVRLAQVRMEMEDLRKFDGGAAMRFNGGLMVPSRINPTPELLSARSQASACARN